MTKIIFALAASMLACGCTCGKCACQQNTSAPLDPVRLVSGIERSESEPMCNDSVELSGQDCDGAVVYMLSRVHITTKGYGYIYCRPLMISKDGRILKIGQEQKPAAPIYICD